MYKRFFNAITIITILLVGMLVGSTTPQTADATTTVSENYICEKDNNWGGELF